VGAGLPLAKANEVEVDGWSESAKRWATTLREDAGCGGKAEPDVGVKVEVWVISGSSKSSNRLVTAASADLEGGASGMPLPVVKPDASGIAPGLGWAKASCGHMASSSSSMGSLKRSKAWI